MNPTSICRFVALATVYGLTTLSAVCAAPPVRQPCLVDESEVLRARAELDESPAWLRRFGFLLNTGQLDAGPLLFVSQAGASSRLRLEQYDGGRDAKYVVVSRLKQTKQSPNSDLWSVVPPREVLGYHPHVAGTDLIYDLTAEAMQGKARPFECDLAGVQAKVYAILPVQIEAIAARIEASPAGRVLRVEFHDASGERLQAVLPFHFSIHLPNGTIHNQGYYATQCDGRFASHPKLLESVPAGARVVIRSQLTGGQETIVVGE